MTDVPEPLDDSVNLDRRPSITMLGTPGSFSSIVVRVTSLYAAFRNAIKADIYTNCFLFDVVNDKVSQTSRELTRLFCLTRPQRRECSDVDLSTMIWNMAGEQCDRRCSLQQSKRMSIGLSIPLQV